MRNAVMVINLKPSQVREMTLNIRYGNGVSVVVSGFLRETAERDNDPYMAKGNSYCNLKPTFD